MNCRILGLLAIALIGASPSQDLVAGAVRDQSGAPIAGAKVEARPDTGTPIVTQTAADGTFALGAGNAAEVRITCSFCVPTIAQIASDGTVVAIVRRFRALTENGPSSEDIAALPYARVESDLSLTPFVLLEDSSSALPGPQISDRGASTNGGLLVDNSIPNYDVVANVSPFYSTPQRYSTGVTAYGSQEAYNYGDVADGGTFFSSPNDANADTALGGNDYVARASVGSSSLAGSAGYSSDATDQQARADFNASFAGPLTTTHVSLLDSRADDAFPNAYDLSSTFSGINVGIERSGPIAIDTSLTADRGSYSVTNGTQLSAAWSDIGANVDIHSNAAVAPFARFSFRESSGSYNSASALEPADNTLSQAQSEGGIRFQGSPTIDGVLAIGIDDITYASPYPGAFAAAFAHNAIAQFHYHPTSHWSLGGSDASNFRLPTFLQLNAAGAERSVPIEQESTLEATLDYTDTSRLRLGLTALSQHENGFEQGTVASVGTSLTWQIAPKISARLWEMRVNPNETELFAGLLGAMPRTANVGSGWITYDNDGAFRVDMIWRRDLLDWDPNAHLDASASAPLSHRLRWYISTEKRDFSRYNDIGLRW